jgi:hypothetical protein
VKGLEEFISKFPGRVSHSKAYRTANLYINKRVLVIGNSASGHDITTLLLNSGNLKLPLYQSRRTPSRWDGSKPPKGTEWKPIIGEYNSSTGDIIFTDGTILSNIDHIIYCTGYKPSFPFWNEKANGGPLYDYDEGRLLGNFQHTFSRAFPQTLGIVGLPRVLTFRAFEYQAVALARLFAGRNKFSLPSASEQKAWELYRAKLVKAEGRKFHDIQWDNDETMDWLRFLYDFSGLPALEGYGKSPPVLDSKTRWAIENVRKYPDHKGEDEKDDVADLQEWIVVPDRRKERDSLHFI